MEMELQRKNIQSINVLLSYYLSALAYNTLLHQINITIKGHIEVIKLRHRKKPQLKQETTSCVDEPKRFYFKYTMHNFSSCALSNEEHTGLLFSLDHHIQTKSKDITAKVEFEQFYQGLLTNLTRTMS